MGEDRQRKLTANHQRRVARYETTIRDDTNNKKKEYDEYFA